MPTQYEYHTIRLAFDMAKPDLEIVDKLRGRTPVFWRGNDLRFEVAVLNNGAVVDVGNLSSLTLEVRPILDIDGTPAMQKTVASGSLDNTLTDSTWSDNTNQHAEFDFSDAETNLASPGDDYPTSWQAEYFIVLSGITSSGNVVTYGAGRIFFREDGAGSAGSPPTNDPNYYTMAQVDAGFVAVTGDTMTGALVLNADPVVALGAATKQYVDNATDLVSWKKSCRAASTANVNISSAPSSIDGVTLSNGDRVLLKDQSTASQNGIYIFNGAASAMTRSGDANTDALMESGFSVTIQEGTVNADRTFQLTTNEPITVGSTSLTFTQSSALGQVSVPSGLTKTNAETLAWHASTHAQPAGVDATTAGSAATPAFSRSTDLNTGVFFPAADKLGLSTGGTERVHVDDAGNVGLHNSAPAFPLDVTGQVRATQRMIAPAFETPTGGIAVWDVATATIASNNLPFPDTAQHLRVGAGTVNTVSNVRAGAPYIIEATGAVTLTDSASINCRNGQNVVLAAGEAVLAVGVSPTSIAVLAPSNGHRVASGSAAAPAIYFDAETNMGLYRSAAGIIGFSYAGTERIKLGTSGNNIQAEFPTYNFILHPSSSTAGRGNIGLFGQASFDATGKQVLAWAPGTAPAGGLADAAQLWVADRNATAGKASLHVNCEDGTSHVFGDRFGIGTTNPNSAFDAHVAGSNAQIVGTATTAGSLLWVQNYSSGSVGGRLALTKAKGSETTPNAVTTANTLGRVEFGGYNGSSTVMGAQIDSLATENWSGSQNGAYMRFYITEPGGTVFTETLKLDEYVNTLLGGATRPTALVKGVVLPNGTAASADPSAGVAFWSVSGAWQYRTSGASEGSGQTNFVHNRAAQVNCAGSNYSLTASYAFVDFGTTDPVVTLPTAGTYLLNAVVGITADAGGAGDEIHAKLRNTTDGADVSQDLFINESNNNDTNQILIQAVVTVTASKTIQLWAYNASAARGTAVASQTSIQYVRLH